MRPGLLVVVFSLAIHLVVVCPARAVVDPALQPNHLYERYQTVVGLRIVKIDDAARTLTLQPAQACKGQIAAKEITLRVADPQVDEAFQETVRQGGLVVALIGKARGGTNDDILFYPGDGRWQNGVRRSAEAWDWTRDLGIEAPGNLFGTFNGQAERLLEMLQDCKTGRYYFPAVPFTRFQLDAVVGKLEGPARGVALYDLDGDGDLDIIATSPAGNRVYLQAGPMKFEDATAVLGLAGTRSVSVSVADADGDGAPDVLLDGELYVTVDRAGKRAFAKSPALALSAGPRVKCAAFVELNGDGRPDVVVAREKGGLEVYLHRGVHDDKALYHNATAAAGLGQESCGGASPVGGYFAPGDWNGDGRTDLFYAVESGLFLVQDEQGRFAAEDSTVRMDFRTAGASQGLAGAGCFAPLWTAAGSELICTSQSELNLVARIDGRPQSITGYGNEITESTTDMLALVAEDLDADGQVDVYAASRSALPNMFYANRGYGSFMTPHKYAPDAFPGRAHQNGAWGLAAGDVNGDGANDLLLGGLDGTLTLMVSDVLGDRVLKEDSTYHQQKLAGARIVTVRVRGSRGVLGAVVGLADAQGRILSRRVLGSNVATGCRGPDEVNFVVREPAPGHAVNVRFSDGVSRTWPVDFSKPDRRVVINAARE